MPSEMMRNTVWIFPPEATTRLGMIFSAHVVYEIFLYNPALANSLHFSLAIIVTPQIFDNSQKSENLPD
jgi:hypothetical protein